MNDLENVVHLRQKNCQHAPGWADWNLVCFCSTSHKY